MWAILDLETTGLLIKKDRIIEWAIVLYEPSKKKLIHCQSGLVCDETVSLSQEIIDITGITHEMLSSSAMTYKHAIDIISYWLGFPGVTHLAAHYGAQFDVPMLQMEFIRQQVKFPELKSIDSYTDLPWPKKTKNKSLNYAAADHGFLNPFPHRALPDCLTLMRLLSEYDYEEIERRAASPTITLKSLAPFDDREKVKAAGFRWSPERKEWTKQLKQFELELPEHQYQFSVQRVMAT